MNDQLCEEEALDGCLSNLTVLDKAVLDEAMRAALNRPFFRILRIAEPVLAACFLGLGLWALLAGDAGHLPLWCGFLVLMIGFFYVQQFVWYPRKAVKNQLMHQAMDDGQAALENRLWFTEENVANRRGEGGQVLHMPYGRIKRLTETPRLLILTTRSNRLIPLDKQGFENGSAEDLKKLLRRKVVNLK